MQHTKHGKRLYHKMVGMLHATRTPAHVIAVIHIYGLAYTIIPANLQTFIYMDNTINALFYHEIIAYTMPKNAQKCGKLFFAIKRHKPAKRT